MEGRLSTGVQDLDRALEGGLAPGTLLLLQTPPGSQGELLLKELALAQETLFLTTTRSESAIRDWITGDTVVGGLDIQHVGYPVEDAHQVATVNEKQSARTRENQPDTPDTKSISMSSLSDGLAGAPEHGFLLMDPVTPLEDLDESAYLKFLNTVRNQLVDTGSVGVLHALKTDDVPRCRWLSLQFADAVWDVRVQRDGMDVAFTLGVTKSRGGHLPDEEIKLDLSDRVEIDVSRDIA